MKIKIKLFAAIIGIGSTLFFACTSTKDNPIQKAKWLLGTWKNEMPQGNIYETWSAINEHEFAGKSYLIQEKDTSFFEHIQLLQKSNAFYYIPTVKNQNEGLPIRFKAKKVSKNQLVFENLKHDFPQLISYTKIHSDSLVAEISGIRKGKKHRQLFFMKRVY
ncbi:MULTISPECIES: DUF6265 family protein [unclassified Aureispira]|uniref:DUF6265 family protein n=1 Tax=unclassified Aureispira TaxID=2649989 RepID=UPI0006979CDB|nr:MULTISPECIES: DUF6265 family protein [unclassified Aureispira]WMX12346.1 DUF6265 family protein [Aureispira sp. CCB-E]